MKYAQSLKLVGATIAVGATLVAIPTFDQQLTGQPTTVQAASKRTIGKTWQGHYLSNSIKMVITGHYIKIDTDLAHVGSYQRVKNGWYRINFTNFKPLYMKYQKSEGVMAIRYRPSSKTYYFFEQA